MEGLKSQPGDKKPRQHKGNPESFHLSQAREAKGNSGNTGAQGPGSPVDTGTQQPCLVGTGTRE